jgi:DNA-binding LytR/AlgR family response regulator
MIFCTNHNDLVFTAFEINTFFFVRKDHLEEDLRKAFDKYFRTCYRGLFQINDNRQIPLTKISFLEVSGNNLTITLQDGKEIETRKTLKASLEQVPSDQFIQISKYCVVNLGYVQDVRGMNCILSNGKKLQISRSRKKEVLEKFDQFLASRL